ncbi:MAG: hypothetical protein QW555_06715 [Nitrososphaerota archaeon]
MQAERILRRVIKLGGSRAVTIPGDWFESEWCWVSREDGRIVIRPAQVR